MKLSKSWILVLFSSSRIRWPDCYKHFQLQIISSPSTSQCLKVLLSVHLSTQGPYHNVRTNVMNECAGSWKEKHLSGLATLTRHDFHLAWPIHAFPPTQQPAAGGGESQTSRAASWRNTTAGAKGADSPGASLKTKPLGYDGKIWFQWCGLRWEEHHACFCTVAEL